MELAEHPWLMHSLHKPGQVVVENVDWMPEMTAETKAWLIRNETSSAVIAPVVVRKKISGILADFERVPREWDGGSVNLIKHLANIIGLTLEKNRVEEEAVQLNDSLRVSNKVLRHDVRNELMVVSGSIGLYERSKDEEHLKRALTSTEKINALIDEFKRLDSFLLSGKGPFSCQLKELVDKSMTNSQMSFSIQGKGAVLADLALGSVIDNLIRNARVHGKATRVDFVIETIGLYTELRIEDDGKGVPEDIRGKIFYEGYSFGETKGTGLGLYLAKKTMERYGGKIRMENTVPHGATFVLSFPRMESFPG